MKKQCIIARGQFNSKKIYINLRKKIFFNTNNSTKTLIII